MKINRSYLLGLGSGILLSALLTYIIPAYSFQLFSSAPSGIAKAHNEEGQGALKGAEDSKEQGNVEESAKGDSLSNAADVTENKQPDSPVKLAFTIKSGTNAEEIAVMLSNLGLIKDKEEFLQLVKQQKAASRFRAGSYTLSKGLNAEDVLKELIKK